MKFHLQFSVFATLLIVTPELLADGLALTAVKDLTNVERRVAWVDADGNEDYTYTFHSHLRFYAAFIENEGFQKENIERCANQLAEAVRQATGGISAHHHLKHTQGITKLSGSNWPKNRIFVVGVTDTSDRSNKWIAYRHNGNFNTSVITNTNHIRSIEGDGWDLIKFTNAAGNHQVVFQYANNDGKKTDTMQFAISLDFPEQYNAAYDATRVLK